MKLRHSAIHLTGLLLALSACGEGADAPKKEITRVEIPDNAFKPVELEATIQGLVSELEAAPPQAMQIGVVLKTLVGFWEPIMLGANRAIGELEVPGVVVAPTETTPEQALVSQLEILSAQLENGYNALGIAPMADGVSTEIANFSDSGAPVVTIDGDLPESRRDLYIGTINREAGATSAETLLELMPATSGTIILLGHDTEEWPDGYQRTMGAKEVLEQQGFQTIVKRTTWADGGIPLDVAAMKDDIMTAEPPVVGMLGLFSAAYRCAMAAEEAGKTGDDITIVGFDFEPETVQFMQSGMMKATHAQRQYYMGYLVPYVLYSVDVLGIERTRALLGEHMVDGSRFNAGLDVVKPDQLDEYNDFLDSLGIGG